jgi:hypothetical protein
MEDLVTRLIAVSPIAAALIGMSWQFLRYMRSRDKEWADTVKIMSTKQNTAHEVCTTTVKENTLMMGQVKQLLETRIRQIGDGHG